MESTVSLQPNMDNPYNWILWLGLVLLITFVIGIASIQQKKPKRAKNKPVANKYRPSHSLSPVQEKYIGELKVLENKCDNKGFVIKEGYQTLSILFRNFVQEYTGMEVTNKTLSELKLINCPIIAELVSMYYEPEFARESFDEKDLKNAIKETRKAIKGWN